MPLYIVLSSGKIPHKIAEVHIPHLVTEEKAHVLSKSGCSDGPAAVVTVTTHLVHHRVPLCIAPHIVQLRFSHPAPVDILIGMPLLGTPHPGEHTLGIAFIFILPVLIHLVILLLALVIAGFSFRDTGGPVVEKCTIYQRVVTILLAVQVAEQ